jgi:predicted esterase
MVAPGVWPIREAKELRLPNRETKRVSVPGKLISDVIVHSVDKPSRLYLLLHGFSQSGEKIYSRIESAILHSKEGAKAFILAPNGPYPMAQSSEDGWRVGFSWYFHDPAKDDYFINMDNSIALLNGMISEMGLQGVPTTVIGFSQGGYLSPLFAEKCPQVDHVIGIGCEFLKDEMQPGKPRFRLDQIHGDDDDIVTAQNSKNSHETLVSRGAEGIFTQVPGEGHSMNLAILAVLKTLI